MQLKEPYLFQSDKFSIMFIIFSLLVCARINVCIHTDTYIYFCIIISYRKTFQQLLFFLKKTGISCSWKHRKNRTTKCGKYNKDFFQGYYVLMQPKQQNFCKKISTIYIKKYILSMPNHINKAISNGPLHSSSATLKPNQPINQPYHQNKTISSILARKTREEIKRSINIIHEQMSKRFIVNLIVKKKGKQKDG